MKNTFCAFCLLVAILLCSCVANNANESEADVSVLLSEESQMNTDEWPDYLLEFTTYWTADGIPGYSYPEVSPETEPVFTIDARENFFAGCESVKLYLSEQNGKQFCYYRDIYFLEKKSSSGEWEFIEFENGHLFYFESAFAGNSKGVKPKSHSFQIYAKDHGLENFEAGEYRVTKTAVCLVNGEERQSIVTGEFTIK